MVALLDVFTSFFPGLPCALKGLDAEPPGVEVLGVYDRRGADVGVEVVEGFNLGSGVVGGGMLLSYEDDGAG